MKKKLFIFTNESIFLQDEKFFCDNIDLKSSPEGLNKKFDMLVDLSINYYKQRVLPFKNFRLPSEFETKTIKNLVTYLKDLDAKTSNEEIQSIVFKVGKEAGYENLREWFSCLYETALGQSSGPRMGGFIKLYGINKSIKLLEDVLNGNLVK